MDEPQRRCSGGRGRDCQALNSKDAHRAEQSDALCFSRGFSSLDLVLH